MSNAVHDLTLGITTNILEPVLILELNPLTYKIAYFLILPPENTQHYTYLWLVRILT